jgi:hypothetical protein
MHQYSNQRGAYYGALALALAIALCAALAPPAGAATVNFVEGVESGVRFVDVFIAGAHLTDFNYAYLLVTPIEGGLLDPIRNLPQNAGDFDDITDGARLDTWATPLFSSFSSATPGFVFNEYPPAVPPDPLPAAGAAIDQLDWIVFDTESCDCGGPLEFEFHFARILYTPRGRGEISVRVFDTANDGELFGTIYGIPEPATVILPGAGLLSCVWLFGTRRSGEK